MRLISSLNALDKKRTNFIVRAHPLYSDLTFWADVACSAPSSDLLHFRLADGAGLSWLVRHHVMLKSISSASAIQISLISQTSKLDALIQDILYATVKHGDIWFFQSLDRMQRMKSSSKQNVLNVDVAYSSNIFLIQQEALDSSSSP